MIGAMDAMMKWIGGGTVAVAAVFAGAAIAASLTGDDANAHRAPTAVERPAQAREAPAPVTRERMPAAVQPAVATQDDPDPAAMPGDRATPAPARLQRVPEPLVVKRILPIDGPLRYGEYHWDEEGVPPGKIVITVDLDARVISIFRGGYEIGAAAALLGTPEHPTPTGTFPILTKERHNVSEKYGNAPMPWTLRLTWDGVAIHGGGEVTNGYASHGCVGVPDGFAAKLFAATKKGDTVVITRGKQLGMGEEIL